MIMHHLVREQVIPAWLSCLPIKNDLIEAKLVHEQLCAMLEK
jgi:importin-5